MSIEAKNVGVKAIEIYFPSRRIQYRERLGDGLAARNSETLDSYAFCDDREDEESMALTVLASLFRSRPQAVHPGSIGRLELAISSGDPASRSLGSLLKAFFHPAGNTSIVGVQSVPGCEGGQDAVLNTVNWIHSSEWDGRDGLVVLDSAKQAEKEEGAALAAILIGPDAPVVLDECPRALCFRHPCERFHHDSSSSSPSSNDENFLSCLAQCYRQIQSQDMIQQEQGATEPPDRRNQVLTLDRFQRVLFQCPSLRLTRKAYAYLLYLDFLASPENAFFDCLDTATQAIAHERGFVDEVQEAFFVLSEARYEERIRPSLAFLKVCGYAHAATLWASLASVLATDVPDDDQKRGASRVLLFAYGDGVMSAMYTATMGTDAAGIIDGDSFRQRLEEGTVVPQEVFDRVSKSAAEGETKLSGNIEAIGRDTYYLHRMERGNTGSRRIRPGVVVQHVSFLLATCFTNLFLVFLCMSPCRLSVGNKRGQVLQILVQNHLILVAQQGGRRKTCLLK